MIGNDTYENSADPPAGSFAEEHQGLQYFAEVLYGLLCVVGLGGNLLVIYVVMRYSKMQTVTNMYILNLSVADMSFPIIVIYNLIEMNTDQWTLGDYLCRFFEATASITDYVHTIFLTILIADRYVAICYPMWALRVRTSLVSKIVSCAAWAASVIIVIPTIMYSSIKQNLCGIYWPDGEYMKGNASYILYTFLLGFFIPLMLIFVFSFLVIRRLREDASRSCNLSASSESIIGDESGDEQQKQYHREVTRLVLIVIAVYVFCEIPEWVMSFIDNFGPPLKLPIFRTAQMFVHCFSFATYAINPILYAFVSESFRKSFAEAFTCTTRRDGNTDILLEIMLPSEEIG